jgi:hypothetical protein
MGDLKEMLGFALKFPYILSRHLEDGSLLDGFSTATTAVLGGETSATAPVSSLPSDISIAFIGLTLSDETLVPAPEASTSTNPRNEGWN